jgi:hypothetical protein
VSSTDSRSKLCGDVGSTCRARQAGAGDSGSMAPAAAEVRVGDGGGAAWGQAFRSEAARATSAAEAGEGRSTTPEARAGDGRGAGDSGNRAHV